MKNLVAIASALGAAVLVGAVATNVSAQVCPADLSALHSQISDPSLKTMLDKPFDDLIAEAGSLESALEETRSKLADLKARRVALPADASDFEKALYDEAIVIGEHRVTGLECRLGD